MIKKQLVVLVTFITVVYSLRLSTLGEQSCNVTEYTCPPTYECKPREQRCTINDNCTYPDGDNKCLSHVFYEGAYAVRVGYVPVMKTLLEKPFPLRHRFVQYRGFSYEYSPRYRVNILDVADPLYKYRFQSLVERYRRVGYSHCSYEEVALFTEFWNSRRYDLLFNNCIHFSNALIQFLIRDSCQRKRPMHGQFWKRSVSKEINDIVLDMSVHCPQVRMPLIPEASSQANDKLIKLPAVVLYSLMFFI